MSKLDKKQVCCILNNRYYGKLNYIANISERLVDVLFDTVLKDSRLNFIKSPLAEALTDKAIDSFGVISDKYDIESIPLLYLILDSEKNEKMYKRYKVYNKSTRGLTRKIFRGII